jgi:zinc-ribbon domain
LPVSRLGRRTHKVLCLNTKPPNEALIDLPETELFCKSCGRKLEPDAQFCPSCGTPTKAPPLIKAATGGKVGGVDKRVAVVIVVILLILMLPVFPRDKIVYVSGQTMTTELYQSTSFQTSLQAYTTTSQTSISVYTGTLLYVQNQYYNYYYAAGYFTGCYRGPYGYVHCGGYYNWPSYNLYTTTVTINPSDRVVSVQDTRQANGYLSTVTLTKADGSTTTYTNVFNDNLAQTGTSTVQVVVTQTSTVTQTTMVPATTAVNVPCDNCIPQHVTEHVSILQLLLGI